MSGDVRQHMIKDHGFTDFGMFGDTPKEQAMYLEGAHGQMHEYEQTNHEHANLYGVGAYDENPRPDLYNDRRQEGRRNAPR